MAPKGSKHGKGKGGAAATADEDTKTCESDLIIKFPRTPHVMNAGGTGVASDDIVLGIDAAKFWWSGIVVSVEEKIDGANLGIFIDEKDMQLKTQNRSHLVYESTTAADSNQVRQFSGLNDWLTTHREELYELLVPGQHVLFGEWMRAKHSIHYTKLPDLFIAFDIYDKKHGKFLSRVSRDRLLAATTIKTVPLIAARKAFSSSEELLALLDTPSTFCEEGFVEGVYLRLDDPEPEDETTVTFLKDRAKLVRPDFVQGITDHWTRGKLVKNVVAYD